MDTDHDFKLWETMESWNKDKDKIDHLVKSYDAFLICEEFVHDVTNVLGTALSEAGKAPVTLKPGDDISKAVDDIQMEAIKVKKKGGPILRFLGSNLMTRSYFDEDDEIEKDLIIVHELAEGNLEKYLWQRFLTLSGHEAFQGACYQIAKGAKLILANKLFLVKMMHDYLILTAVLYIHQHCLAHLALNPWNIFFVREGSTVVFKIGDFGFSLHADERESKKVMREGKHQKYIAPEFLRDLQSGHGMKQTDSGATFADIYSLGMIYKDIKKHIGNHVLTSNMIMPNTALFQMIRIRQAMETESKSYTWK